MGDRPMPDTPGTPRDGPTPPEPSRSVPGRSGERPRRARRVSGDPCPAPAADLPGRGRGVRFGRPARSRLCGPGWMVYALRAGPVFGDWCNGSTTDSDSVSLGSNPRSPVFSLHRSAVTGRAKSRTVATLREVGSKCSSGRVCPLVPRRAACLAPGLAPHANLLARGRDALFRTLIWRTGRSVLAIIYTMRMHRGQPVWRPLSGLRIPAAGVHE